MRRFDKLVTAGALSAAVAAILASNSAFALDPTVAGNLPPFAAAGEVNLVVSGSSAQRDTMKAQFQGLCQAGTFDQFRASSSDTPDLRAYTCKLLNAAPVPAASRNQKAVLYYRSEGGSIYGVEPIAVAAHQIYRLVPAAPPTCTLNVANDYICPATLTANPDTESGTGQVVKAPSMLGVSDVEPSRFAGENFPSGLEFPSVPSYAGVTTSPTVGVVFGIAVNTQAGSPAAALTSISKETVASIFSGAYSDWSQVPNGNAPLASAGIVVCRRDIGSGTQVAASVQFNGQGCSTASSAFVHPTLNPPFGGNTVVVNNSSTAMKNCIANNPGAIGFLNYQTAALTNGKFLAVQSSAPSKLNAALGDYDYWYEGTINKGSTINTGANANNLAIANLLISRLQTQSTVPVNDSTLALANGGVNTPVLPVSTTLAPVALGTRGGNSCAGQIGGN